MTEKIDDKKVEELLVRIASGEITAAKARGITEEELESVYALAYNFYVVADYAKAETLFRFLTMMSHRDEKYWMGLAGALQARKEWKGALQAYAYVCSNIHSRNVKASLHAAECYLQLGDRQNAGSALMHVRKFADPATAEGREVLQAATELAERIVDR